MNFIDVCQKKNIGKKFITNTGMMVEVLKGIDNEVEVLDNEGNICSLLTYDNYIEYRKNIAWEKVKTNEKILVSNYDNGNYKKAYFAKYEDGVVYVWVDGKTEWSSNGKMQRYAYATTIKESKYKKFNTIEELADFVGCEEHEELLYLNQEISTATNNTDIDTKFVFIMYCDRWEIEIKHELGNVNYIVSKIEV